MVVIVAAAKYTVSLTMRSSADVLLFADSLIRHVRYELFGLLRVNFTASKMYRVFDENCLLLPLSVWDLSCCNRSSFEFEPLDANGTM